MTVDYHDYGDRFLPQERRRQLRIGDVYVNAATCLACGDYIRSRNRHVFVTCSCGNIAVDGGSWYARRVGGELGFTNHVEQYADAVEVDSAA